LFTKHGQLSSSTGMVCHRRALEKSKLRTISQVSESFTVSHGTFLTAKKELLVCLDYRGSSGTNTPRSLSLLGFCFLSLTCFFVQPIRALLLFFWPWSVGTQLPQLHAVCISEQESKYGGSRCHVERSFETSELGTKHLISSAISPNSFFFALQTSQNFHLELYLLFLYAMLNPIINHLFSLQF
jgi:hypothetical protein